MRFLVLFGLLMTSAMAMAHPSCEAPANEEERAACLEQRVADLEAQLAAAPPQLADGFVNLGKRRAGWNYAGAAMMPTSILIGTAGWLGGVASDDSLIYGLVGVSYSTAALGSIMAGVATERAVADLRANGIHISATPARVGHVMNGVGIVSSLAGMILLGNDEREDLGFALHLTGAGLMLASAIPYAIQGAIIQKGYKKLEERQASGRQKVQLQPYFSVSDRLVGVSGTF